MSPSRSTSEEPSAPPRGGRTAALLRDLHFWIPLAVFGAGVALLVWLA